MGVHHNSAHWLAEEPAGVHGKGQNGSLYCQHQHFSKLIFDNDESDFVDFLRLLTHIKLEEGGGKLA